MRTECQQTVLRSLVGLLQVFIGIGGYTKICVSSFVLVYTVRPQVMKLVESYFENVKGDILGADVHLFLRTEL